MTKKHKVVGILVASYFAFAFALNVFFGDENTQTSNPVPTASASPSNSEFPCFDIRKKKGELEEQVDLNRREVIKVIESTQKAFLLTRIKQFEKQNLISSEQVTLIRSISEGDPIERLGSFENFLKVSEIFDGLIKNGRLKPYFEKDVIALGEDLASTRNPTYKFVLENKGCFDEFEILLAENGLSFQEKKIKSGWARKKNGSDFAGILAKG